MVSEDDPFVGRDEIATVVQAFSGSGPLGIEGQDFSSDEFAVEAISQRVGAECRNHQPHGVDLLAAVQRDSGQCKGAENSNGKPDQNSQ